MFVSKTAGVSMQVCWSVRQLCMLVGQTGGKVGRYVGWLVKELA